MPGKNESVHSLWEGSGGHMDSMLANYGKHFNSKINKLAFTFNKTMWERSAELVGTLQEVTQLQQSCWSALFEVRTQKPSSKVITSPFILVQSTKYKRMFCSESLMNIHELWHQIAQHMQCRNMIYADLLVHHPQGRNLFLVTATQGMAVGLIDLHNQYTSGAQECVDTFLVCLYWRNQIQMRCITSSYPPTCTNPVTLWHTAPGPTDCPWLRFILNK